MNWKGTASTREHCMFHSWLGFLAVVYFGPSPPPPPCQPFFFFGRVVSLSQSSCVSPVELTDGRGGGSGSKSIQFNKLYLGFFNWQRMGTSYHKSLLPLWVFFLPLSCPRVLPVVDPLAPHPHPLPPLTTSDHTPTSFFSSLFICSFTAPNQMRARQPGPLWIMQYSLYCTMILFFHF